MTSSSDAVYTFVWLINDYILGTFGVVQILRFDINTPVLKINFVRTSAQKIFRNLNSFPLMQDYWCLYTQFTKKCAAIITLTHSYKIISAYIHESQKMCRNCNFCPCTFYWCTPKKFSFLFLARLK